MIIATRVCKDDSANPGCLGAPCLQELPPNDLLQDADLTGRDCVFGPTDSFWKSATKTRGGGAARLPLPTSSPPKVVIRVRGRGRVRSGVGLVWADVKG